MLGSCQRFPSRKLPRLWSCSFLQRAAVATPLISEHFALRSPIPAGRASRRDATGSLHQQLPPGREQSTQHSEQATVRSISSRILGKDMEAVVTAILARSSPCAVLVGVPLRANSQLCHDKLETLVTAALAGNGHRFLPKAPLRLQVQVAGCHHMARQPRIILCGLPRLQKL